jgi:hypothetical protein
VQAAFIAGRIFAPTASAGIFAAPGKIGDGQKYDNKCD